ncbi:MAG: right-handed parallel beta-helix repeat-containing protein [Anaerolineae bacterium]|nr:right-handed parallel beta-helix repeat-containing protein [Anaerolineae bacterium]
MKKINALPKITPVANSVVSDLSIQPNSQKSSRLLFRLGSVFLLAFCMLLVAFLWLLGLPEVMQAAGPPIRYVASTGSDAGNDCSNTFNPCETIQNAIDQADPGDEIRVATGVYTKSISIGQAITLRGGYTTADWVASNPDTNVTTIDAEGADRVVHVAAAVEVTISGFDITGGSTTLVGGGVYNERGILTIENSNIFGNSVTGGASGGGVVNGNPSLGFVAHLTIRNSRIYANTAAGGLGGGIQVLTGTATIEASEIFSNTAGNAGGIDANDGAVILRSNLIYNNQVITSVGGIGILNADVDLINNTIFGNNGANQGGGIFFGGGSIDIVNSLIADNTAVSGGGIYSSANNITINFTDFSGNNPDDINNGSISINPTTIGSNNFIRDPLFVNPATFNLHLSPSSPAINSGTDVALAFDFEGEGRPFGAGFDRGADEAIDTLASCFARVEGGQVYTTVQQALNDATGGDLVQVAGLCDAVETVNSLNQIAYITQTLTLRGGYTVTDWINPVYGPTVFDASGGGRAIYIEGPSSISPIIENLRLTGGAETDGAGVYLGSNVNATLRNNIIHDNAATGQGGGVYNASGSTSTLLHNTIYNNSASSGGGVYGASGGQVTLRSNIVANNTADGLAAVSTNAVSLDYNNFDNTTNYSNPAFAGPNDISDSPDFVNAGGNDFRLQSSSTSINAADPASPVTTDFENDPRPQGSRADIGADESRLFADVLLSEAPESPQVVTDTAQIVNSVITFTHTITNLGNIAANDTFIVTTSNSDGWTVNVVPASLSPLNAGDSTTFEVLVQVPGTVPDPLYNQTIVTATSQSNAGTFASVIDLIASPSVELIDNDDPPFEDPQSLDPGDVITYTYTLRNSGPTTDTFTIDMTSTPFGWGTLIAPPDDTTPITLAAGSSASIIVRVAVAETAPNGLAEIVKVTATSQNFDVSATVTDTTIANGTIGDRYVSLTGNNTNNNCTVSTSPCRTINYAVGQAAAGDAVRVAQGTYVIPSGININDPIELYGGYDNAFSSQSGAPADTQIDIQNIGRGLTINANPGPFAITIDNLTIKNANASGAGGGIFLQQSPAITLSRLIIQDSSATQGAGIYLSSSTSPIIVDQVVVSNTTASNLGGGIYVAGGSPLLSNVSISNTTANRGGGIYVAGGTPTLTSSHIYGANASTTGGGLYQALGTLTVERTRVEASSAASGGGVYVSGGTLNLRNNFVYSNTTTGSGAGIYNNGILKAAHNTLYANQAGSTGGGVFDNNTSGLVLSNMIFAANSGSSGGAFYRGDGGTVSASIAYNLYFNNTPNNSNVSTGANTRTGDPFFADVAAGDLHLTADSAAVDAGDPASTVTDDIDGDFRPINQGFDIGADELSGCLARVLAAPDTIYGVLQNAIDAAGSGDTVQVSGTCRGVQPRLVGGQTISQTAIITGNIIIAGGYNSTFDNNPDTDPVTTTLDAQGLGRTLVVTDSATVSLSRLTLTGGQANDGGGLYNGNSQLQTIDLTVSGNQAVNGAGVYNLNGTTTLSRTTLISNTGGSGGAAYNAAGSLTTEGVIAANNTALIDGGGFYNAGGATLTLVNTILTGNTAPSGNGGGLYNESDNLTVRHDAFYLNQANQGGGIYHDAGSATPIINSTILISNTAGSGGGIFSNGTDPTFGYNDVFGNTGGGYGGISDQTGVNGNIAVDPNFLSTTLTDANFLHISSGSPVEDQGDPASPIIIDIDQDPRPSNQNPDIGVDEVAGCFARINTDPRIYGAVQTAIDAATDGDVVRVAGVCAGVRPFDDGGTVVNQTILITKPITVQGGYTKTNNLDGPSDPETNPTVLDALGGGRTVYITTTSNSLIVLEGLHLRGGNDTNGGAMLVRSGVVSMTHNRIYSNTATSGGAIYNEAGTVTLQGDNLLDTGDNEIYGNTATDGGALYNAGGQMTVDDALLHDNTATDGGAFYHAGGTSVLQNNILRDNSADNGGAIYNASTGLTVRHNTVYSNDAATNGGGFYTENASPTVVNNIFSDNTATTGHAIFSTVAFTPDYNNAFPDDANGYGGSATAGPNSLADDPGFIDAAGGDFHLSSSSPMIDVGDPSMTLTYDFDNPFDTRPGNQGFDLGADEVPGCLAKVVESDTIYGNLQTAIYNSQPGNTILVTADECRGVHPFNPGSGVVNQTIHITHSLTIEGGYNDAFSAVTGNKTILNPESQGRALFVLNSTVTLMNFDLSNGDAGSLGGGPSGDDAGGGVYLQNSTVSLDQVAVYSNTAQYGGGGFIDATSSLSMTGESEIYNNTATIGGGGLYNDGTLGMAESRIHNNSAVQGGGLYNTAAANLDLGNRFYSNQADQGAAIYHTTSNNLSLVNTFIYNNQATTAGGGVYIDSGNPDILHNTFYSNQVDAATAGGAVYVNSGSPTIKNNIFSQNQANGSSHAIHTAAVGATIDFNNYWTAGVGVQVTGAVVSGGNGVDGDPLLEDPAGEDFHLTANSPAINAGETLGAVTRDFEEDPRPINSASDIGADEVNACLARLDGTIYGSIGAALADADPGDFIDVAEGICEENLTISQDITIEGSWEKDFSAKVTAGSQPVVVTTIDGTASGTVIDITGAVAKADLSWLEISNGQTGGNGGGINSQAELLILSDAEVISNSAVNGGGIYLADNTTADLTNVDLGIGLSQPGSIASSDGGGIYIGSNVTATIENGGVSFNQAAGNGGGMYIASGSDVSIEGGFPISNNEAGGDGGGIYYQGAEFSFINKQINENTAVNGAGMYATGSGSLSFINPNFYQNQATTNGGGFYYGGSASPTLYFATIRENDANQGGGVYNVSGSTTVSASIVASNTATLNGTGIHVAGGSVAVNYTLQWNNTYNGESAGTGNLVADPRFRTADPGGDLSYNSPAIDAVPNAVSEIDFDRFNEVRPQLCAKDMGRDEYLVQEGNRLLEWIGPTPTGATLAPTESVTYTYSVTNQSQNTSNQVDLGPGTGYTETVTITLNSTQNWSEIISVVGGTDVVTQPDGLSASVVLGPGQSATVEVRTTVPPGTFADVVDSTTLDAVGYQCVGGTTTQNTSNAAVTNVEQGVSFTLTPDHFGTAAPGDVLTFTHTLSNTGNLTDTYTLFSNSSGIYVGGVIMQPPAPDYQVTLGPNMSSTVIISLTVSPSAGSGLVESVSAIAQSGLDSSQAGAANTLTINGTSGIRHVSLNGEDLRNTSITDTNVLGDNNCTETNFPCRSIQWALSQAAPDDLIKIEQGIYNVSGTDIVTAVYNSLTVTQIAFIDKAVTLQGGYTDTNWDEDPPNHISQTTTLDPGSAGRAIFVTVNPTGTVTIDRLTIANGDAAGLGGGPGDADAGGALYNDGADLTLTALRLQDSDAAYGGGLYSSDGDLLLQNNFIHGNQATNDGGAVYVADGSATVENDTLYNNSAQNGGAVYIDQGALLVNSSIVATNTTAGGGSGALDNNAASATSDYNLYAGNSGGDVNNITQGGNESSGDPAFIDPTADPPNLHIDLASDAREGGDPGSTLDIDYDNDPRPLPDTGVNDIGADERVPVQSLTFITNTFTLTTAPNTLVITHTLVNDGDVPEQVTLTESSDQGWLTNIEPPLSTPFVVTNQTSRTVTVTYTIPATAAGLINVTTITATPVSTSLLPVTVVDTIQVEGPRWEISKVAEPPDTVQPGGLITYTLTVTNTGELTTTADFTITDQLPLNYVNFVSADPTPISTDPVQWVLSDQIGIGESLTVTLVVSVNTVITDGLAIVNDAYSVTGGGTLGVATGAPVTVTVESTATTEITLAKTVDPPSTTPGGVVTYTITLTNSSPSPVTVALTDTLADGFSPTSVVTDVVVPAATIIGDGVATVSFNATAPLTVGTYVNPLVTATYGLSQTTLIDSAPLIVTETEVDFSQAAYSVDESAGTATITVTLSATSTQPVSVDYATADNTATAGSDYTAVTDTLVFSPGAISATFTIPITDDSLPEANEIVDLNLSNAQGATLAAINNPAQLTIIDDDVLPTIDFSAATYQVDENDPAQEAVITLTLSSAVTNTITVTVESADNTATAGSDYTAISTTLVFPANTTVLTFTVPISDDSQLEGAETLTLTLSSPVSGTLVTAVNNPAVLTILDDEAVTADFSSTSYSVDETAGTATITVTLSATSTQEVGVDYLASNGTATLGSDFGTASGTMTFTSGITQQAFTVPITDDLLFEADETVVLTLLNPNLVNIGVTSPAILTILDNETQPEVDFATSAYTVDETAGTATITVTLSAVAGITATVDYETTDNTATSPADYTAISDTLTFSPGVTQTTFAVTIIDDPLVEGSETLTLTLSNPVSATLATAGNNPATLTIVETETLPEVGFASATYEVDEDVASGQAIITVTLSSAPGLTATVVYSTTDGTATSPADYDATTGVLTFTPGVTVATFPVPINDDALSEGDESLTLSLSSPVSATLGAIDTATLTIIDDEALPVVGYAVTNFSVNEDIGSAVITLTLSAATGTTATVNYQTTAGTASSPADYIDQSGTATFNPGESSTTFTVPIVNDTDIEGDEALTLTLASPVSLTLGSTATATLTIIDDDTPTVDFSAASYSVDETAGTAIITVTMSVSSALQTTVDYATSDGTATDPTDYISTTGTLTFASGITVQTFSVTINDDGVLEGSETVSLALSNVSNANLGNTNNPATLTIIDDDASTIQFEPADYMVFENVGTKVISVTLSPAQAVTATVDYFTSDGTATDPTDYLAASDTLTFTPGITAVTFTVSIVDDTIFEPTESFQLNLTNVVSANIGSPTGTVTIIDGDTPPTVDFETADFSVDENAGPATIVVTLSTASELSATVVYSTSDGTASSASDYTMVTGTLIFNPGEISTTFTIPITDDALYEDDETVLLSLSSPVNAVMGSGSATLTIIDDELPPVVEFDREFYTVEEDVGSAVITVSLSSAAGTDVSVDYQSTDDTALAVSDYTAVSNTLTFSAGTTVLTFTVPITDDALFEDDEQLLLDLSNEISATLGVISQTTLIIRDNDTVPEFAFSTSNFTVDEDAGPAVITVTLSAVAGVTRTVGYSTSDITALSTQDYITTSGALTFPAGITALNFTVPITDDLLIEGDETLQLTLFSLSSESEGAVITTSLLTILDDDDSTEKPFLIAPPNGTITNSNNIDLIWSRVTGALTYTLYLTPTGVFDIPDPGSGSQVISSTVLPEGVYSWTVAAINALDVSSGVTDTWVFTIDNTAPAAPALIAPPNGTLTNDPDVTFVWSDVADAVSYRLALTSPVTSTILGPFTNTSAALTLLDGDGVYTWTVESIDAATNTSGFTDTWTLTLDTTPPTSPTLILPPDGAVFTQTNIITFEWTASVDALSGPVTYTLSLNGVAPQTLAVTSTSLSLADGVYNWTVSATDGAGNTAITGTHTFTVDLSPPPIPTLISPPDQTYTNDPDVTFIWSPSTDALSYTLSISSFGIIDVGNSTTYTATLPEGVYDWTVWAIDSYSRTLGYSDTWRLTVDFTPPTTPTLIAPPDTSVITTTTQPTFEWTASTDALSGPVTYTLVVSNSSGLAFTVDLTGTTYTPPTGLALDTYTWAVQAHDLAGNTATSTTFTFTLQAQPSDLYFPILLKNFSPPEPTPAPDLIISDFSVIPNGDGTYRVSVTAINQGPISVADPNNFHVAVYDTNDLTTPLILWGVQGEWFPSGGGRILTVNNFTFPNSGSLNLRAWADPFNVVVETDNSNNTNDLSVTVTAASGVSPQARPTYPPGPQPTPTQTP